MTQTMLRPLILLGLILATASDEAIIANPHNSPVQADVLAIADSLAGDNCVIKRVQEACHPCSQTEFQLNVDECQTTHHIEKIICYDSEKRENVNVRSCVAGDAAQRGIFSFCLSNLVIGAFAFYCSRRRQRFLDDKRNRRLQTQLQAL